MSDIDEQWRPVVGYEGLYDVSDHGRVRRLRCTRGHVDYEYPTPRPLRAALVSGYPAVILSRGGRTKHYHVHRLVLTAFVGPAPNGMQAAHENGRRTDNHVSNLSWKTHKDNCHDKRRHGTVLCGDRAYNVRYSDALVTTMRLRHGQGESLREIASQYGVPYKQMSVLLHRARTHLQPCACKGGNS